MINTLVTIQHFCIVLHINVLYEVGNSWAVQRKLMYLLYFQDTNSWFWYIYKQICNSVWTLELSLYVFLLESCKIFKNMDTFFWLFKFWLPKVIFGHKMYENHVRHPKFWTCLTSKTILEIVRLNLINLLPD